jgi:hypothetical protein
LKSDILVTFALARLEAGHVGDAILDHGRDKHVTLLL